MPSIAASPPTYFSRSRFALLVLLAVYPLLTVLLYLVMPLTASWPIYARTALITPLMVALLVWGVIPFIQSRFQGFIHRPRRQNAG